MRVIHGVALAAWLLAGTGLAFGQTAPPPPEKNAPAVWRTYVQPAAGFAVSSPVPFDTKLVNPIETGEAQSIMRQFIGIRRSMTFFACFMEMKLGNATGEVLAKNADAVLGTFAVGAAQGVNGELLENTPIEILGHPGRAFQIRLEYLKQKMVSRGRVCLIGTSFYILQVVELESGGDVPTVARASGDLQPVRLVIPDTDGRERDRARFFGSFRLMTDAEKEKFGTTTADAMVDAGVTEKTVDPPPTEAPKSDVPGDTGIPKTIEIAPPVMIVRQTEGVLRDSALRQVTPTYPKAAREARIEGDVVCEIFIDRDGTVVEARILSGPSELHEATLAAARQWTFKPVLLNGQPVRVRGALTFRFNLSKE